MILNFVSDYSFAIARSRRKEVNFGNLDWTFSCDFPGNDIENAIVPGEHCGGTCSSVPGAFFLRGHSNNTSDFFG